MADPHQMRSLASRPDRMERDTGAVTPALTAAPDPARVRFFYGYWLLDDHDSRHLDGVRDGPLDTDLPRFSLASPSTWEPAVSDPLEYAP
jgi:hypothetical protein